MAGDPSRPFGAQTGSGSGRSEVDRGELDPWGSDTQWLIEDELYRRDTGTTPVVERLGTCTVFLRGAECPFGCVFCDLAQQTLSSATPLGAIPQQLRTCLKNAERDGYGAPAVVKLYNASNYFDERAVPQRDDSAVLDLLRDTRRVVVECHPRLVVCQRCSEFAGRLEAFGSRLEVALGLESSHPKVFPRLDKGCELAHFRAAFDWLREREIASRAFVLVGLPWLEPREQVSAVLETVAFAQENGVDSVTLIPLRASEQLLRRAPQWQPPSLGLLETCLRQARRQFDVREGGEILVRGDLWDLDKLEACRNCAEQRKRLLHVLELEPSSTRATALLERRVVCSHCHALPRAGSGRLENSS